MPARKKAAKKPPKYKKAATQVDLRYRMNASNLANGGVKIANYGGFHKARRPYPFIRGAIRASAVSDPIFNMYAFRNDLQFDPTGQFLSPVLEQPSGPAPVARPSQATSEPMETMTPELYDVAHRNREMRGELADLQELRDTAAEVAEAEERAREDREAIPETQEDIVDLENLAREARNNETEMGEALPLDAEEAEALADLERALREITLFRAAEEQRLRVSRLTDEAAEIRSELARLQMQERNMDDVAPPAPTPPPPPVPTYADGQTQTRAPRARDAGAQAVPRTSETGSQAVPRTSDSGTQTLPLASEISVPQFQGSLNPNVSGRSQQRRRDVASGSAPPLVISDPDFYGFNRAPPHVLEQRRRDRASASAPMQTDPRGKRVRDALELGDPAPPLRRPRQ
jgi:hypothetical protein